MELATYGSIAATRRGTAKAIAGFRNHEA